MFTGSDCKCCGSVNGYVGFHHVMQHMTYFVTNLVNTTGNLNITFVDLRTIQFSFGIFKINQIEQKPFGESMISI